ncbi:hypothetical protein ACSBR1_009664 [Camellia fascicularis]
MQSRNTMPRLIFYWAPLLVESNSDDLINHCILDRIVRVQAIERHARYWTDADILHANSIWKQSLLGGDHLEALTEPTKK